MYTMETLEIEGYCNEPVPNTLFFQKNDTEHLAIVIPGIGYTSHMPLLYYPGRLLLLQGADVLRLEYDYGKRSDFLRLTGAERFDWLVGDVSASCKLISSKRPYQKITFIGKSIGTLAMAHLLTNETMFDKARAIWLTPLFRNDRLRKLILRTGQRSLFVIGTADQHYDPDYLKEAQAATKGESLVIEHANHSLEIEGDPFQSLKIMERMMRAIEKFLM